MMKNLLLLMAAILFFSSCGNDMKNYQLPEFYFFDMKASRPEHGDTLVSVKGAWVSDTKLAAEVQTTQLDCWKEMNICIEMTAAIGMGNQNMLSVISTYWDVEAWEDDEIRVKDNESALCTTYRMRIDRKNKTVTKTRTTNQPKVKDCEGIQDEPIVMHLGNKK